MQMMVRAVRCGAVDRSFYRALQKEERTELIYLRHNSLTYARLFVLGSSPWLAYNNRKAEFIVQHFRRTSTTDAMSNMHCFDTTRARHLEQ